MQLGSGTRHAHHRAPVENSGTCSDDGVVLSCRTHQNRIRHGCLRNKQHDSTAPQVVVVHLAHVPRACRVSSSIYLVRGQLACTEGQLLLTTVLLRLRHDTQDERTCTITVKGRPSVGASTVHTVPLASAFTGYNQYSSGKTRLAGSQT